jgi:hypothetical protein
MFSILCIGEDVELLKSRTDLLRTTGSEVQCSRSAESLAALERRKFDLVVVCHSVRCGQAEQIYEAAHRNHGTTVVLRLMPFWVGDQSDFKSTFDAVANVEPAALVRTADALLHRQANHPV